MTSNVVSPRKKIEGDGRQLSPEQAAAAAMVAEAKARGLELTGPNGLLKLFTKNVLETALNEEMTEHIGHETNQAETSRAGVPRRQIAAATNLWTAFPARRPACPATAGAYQQPAARPRLHE